MYAPFQEYQNLIIRKQIQKPKRPLLFTITKYTFNGILITLFFTSIFINTLVYDKCHSTLFIG